jgi:hypothetical protein
MSRREESRHSDYCRDGVDGVEQVRDPAADPGRLSESLSSALTVAIEAARPAGDTAMVAQLERLLP